MKKNPRLEINLEKLRHNAISIYQLCDAKGIEIVGITKGFTAIPEVAQLMVDAGIKILGDSRLENIQALQAAGIKTQMMLIRLPLLSEVDLVVAMLDCSLNSELSTIIKLSAAAIKRNKIHDIILMVDLGDLREGILPEDTLNTVKAVLPLKGIRLKGLGVNLNCVSGIEPTFENLTELVSLSAMIEKEIGIKLEIVSGGSTSSLALLVDQSIPEGINQLRIGEGILLGHSDIFTNLKETFQDSFILTAEIIELKQKETTPRGSMVRDSFGEIPKFKARGIRKRAILAIGKQDVYPEHLVPLDKNITILAASSDHLVIDVTDSATIFRVGDEIQFIPTYPGILSSTTSKYVKVYTT
jgi:predicted amino acid racemase